MVRKVGPPLTPSRLKTVLDYDQDTGTFVWKVSMGRARAGNAAGWHDGRGYIRIGIDGVRYQAHRLAWFFVHQEWPPDDVDHEKDRTDNRIANLRSATRQQNNANRSIASNNTTGFKGVCFDKNRNKYQATIMVDGKTRYLGRFDKPEQAHAAYCGAAEKFFGEFARAA
jgi:hypothetical protein